MESEFRVTQAHSDKLPDSETAIAAGQPKSARWLWIAAGVLFVLHQDFWLWSNQTLVFGFMPIGLLYHAGFSVAAALLWLCMVKFAWPGAVEAWADEDHSLDDEYDARGNKEGAPA